MNNFGEFARETAALTSRWILHSLRKPIVIVAGLFQPLVWLFLFGSVFRNVPTAAILAHGENYRAFLAAGVIMFTAFNAALSAGVPVLFDKENLFLDRLLAAPLASRLSIAAASAIHIFGMSLTQTLLVLGVSAFYSGAITLTLPMVLGVVGFSALLVFGFTAFSLWLAFSLRAHFEMLSLIQLLALPMIFVSTALAPLAMMPEWLRWPASLNPLTLAIEPVRHLLLQRGAGVAVLDAPWGQLGMAGCAGALVLFDLLMVIVLGTFLKRTLR